MKKQSGKFGPCLVSSKFLSEKEDGDVLKGKKERERIAVE